MLFVGGHAWIPPGSFAVRIYVSSPARQLRCAHRGLRNAPGRLLWSHYLDGRQICGQE